MVAVFLQSGRIEYRESGFAHVYRIPSVILGGIRKHKNLDLAGTVSVLPDGGVDSYFRVDNLTLRESGALETNGMNLCVENGVWDIYGGGIAATKLRVGAGSATINLRGENLLGNLNAIPLTPTRA